ncbi:uncharacterized protein [Dermacentor albipictus]|uniref:uncharacterized protein isoform X4 n=1 Tax=Dermacentor albipictus TaxID=60249 RepID=UPI0038FC29B9
MNLQQGPMDIVQDLPQTEYSMGTRFIGDRTPSSDEYEGSTRGPCSVFCMGGTMGAVFFVAAGITLAFLIIRNFGGPITTESSDGPDDYNMTNNSNMARGHVHDILGPFDESELNAFFYEENATLGKSVGEVSARSRTIEKAQVHSWAPQNGSTVAPPVSKECRSGCSSPLPAAILISEQESSVSPAPLVGDSSGKALPPNETSRICKAEEQRLRRLVSLTKAPCNDFYEFVCGRMERELKASASWSPVAQRTLVADSLERRMLLFLQERADATWVHHYVWKSCVEGQPGATTTVTVLRECFAWLGLQQWPLAEQQPVDDKAVTEVTVALSRRLGLDALFRLSLAPIFIEGQMRHIYKVQEAALVVSWCDLPNPHAGPVSRLRALASEAVLLLAPNSANTLDAENSAFRIACMLTKVRSLCGGEKLSKSVVLASMDTLPSVVQASVVDVAGHAENSVGVPCHAFIGHLDTVFQPGNFASLLNYMGFRALLHLSAAVPGREELLEARLEEITGRAQYRWPRPLACLRLAEALVPTLFLHDHYAWFFNDSTITAKDALVEWFVKNLPNVARYSPWGSTPAYIRKIQHHVDSMRLRRYLPSWLFNAKKRRRFNEQLLRGVEAKSFLSIYLGIQNNVYSMRLNRTSARIYEGWDASLFDTMPLYRYEDRSLYIPMGMFAFQEPYVIPFVNETRFIYAAFVGWKIHYAVASVFEEIARSEGSIMNDGTTKLRVSYEQYRKCIIQQYSSKLDKLLSLPLQAAHTFLNDNKDVFAALTILPPLGHSILQNLPVELTAMSSTLTAEQLFYVYYGLGRCVWMRSEHLRTTIESRFFSPPRYRLNLPLRNSRHFRRAWKCGPPSCLLPSDDSL